MGRLDGKTVLVIGGAQGIGEGCALAAASEGANLVIGDVNADGARATADEARSRGVRAVGLAVDVVERDEVDTMVATALDEFSVIDGLVNVAFYNTEVAPLAETSLETFQRQLQVDVVGCMLAMQTVYPHLRGRGGSIVNFSSGAGVGGLPGRAGYAATKAAIRLLSRTAALEWGGDGVRVNAVCPLSTSPSLEAAFEEGAIDRALLEGSNPLGRLGDPETDIGAAVAFLLSEDARYVTGQTIAVDGGNLAHC
jgi:NAD(P)-dependent dehydrogenase (short-subunit alcohol dehydrogenase family)